MPFLSLLYHSLSAVAVNCSHGFFADEYYAEKKSLKYYSQYRDFASNGKHQAESFVFIKNDETVVLSSLATR